MSRELTLHRTHAVKEAALGEILADGERLCFSLEDQVRDGPKVPGKTAIPAGRYRVSLTYSNRFKRVLPVLEDVPDFTGIRMHGGNTEADTEGCILVGLMQDKEHGTIHACKAALALVMDKLTENEPQEWWISVENCFEAPDPTGPRSDSGDRTG